MIRRKLEQQEISRCSRISRKYPGMSYEEIASSRSGGSKKKAEKEKTEEVTSPGKDSADSGEHDKEKAPKDDAIDKHKVDERNDGILPCALSIFR